MGPRKRLKNNHLGINREEDKESLIAVVSVLINIFAQISQGKKLNPRAKSFTKKIIKEFRSTYNLSKSPEEKKAAKLFYFKKYIAALNEKNPTERTKKINQIISAIDASGVNKGPLSKHHKMALHAPSPNRGSGKASAEALALARIEDLFFSYSSSQYYRENKRWDELYEAISSLYGAEMDPMFVFNTLFKDIFGLTGSVLTQLETSLRMSGVSFASPANSGRVALMVFRYGEKLQEYAMERLNGNSFSLLTGLSPRKR